MRHYEAMYIVDPDTSEEQVETVINKYSTVITQAGGEVSDASLWERGRRTLAYPINKKTEGIYVLMQFQSNEEAPKELDRIFRISDDVLRHIVVRQDESEE